MVEYTAKRELTDQRRARRARGARRAPGRAAPHDRQKVVFFKAEDEAPYGEVVRLMDMARGSGARTLAVVTK